MRNGREAVQVVLRLGRFGQNITAITHLSPLAGLKFILYSEK
jgi:hypothetical protein